MFIALCSSLSMFLANATSAAMQSQQSTEQMSDALEKDENVEVIGIVGERTTAYFRVQMEKAEIDFYDGFNLLADNDKFKVMCRREKRPGSNISGTACYPKYLLDKLAQANQDALERGLPQPSLKDVQLKGKKDREESMAYVEKVVIENPQLLKKLIALNERQAKYEESKLNR